MLAHNVMMLVCHLSLTALAVFSAPASAIHCALTNFSVETYDHTGTYLSGLLDGRVVSFIMICGVTSGGLDCSSPATNRNLAVALSAQARGKHLVAYFGSASTCASVANYTNVTALILQP